MGWSVLRSCTQCVIDVSELANEYIQENAPWQIVKKDAQRAASVIGVAINAIRLLGNLVEPFMPSIAESIFRQVRVRWSKSVY